MTTLYAKFARALSGAGVLFFGLTSFAYAQSNNGSLDTSNLGNFLRSIIGFIDTFLIPLVFAIAFLVFIWGIYQYFIAGGASEEKRDSGKQLILWGLIGFFVMFSVWGIINLLLNSLRFNSQTRPCYPTFGGPCNTTSSGTTNTGNTTNGGVTVTNGGGNPVDNSGGIIVNPDDGPIQVSPR
jgi:hypothetical protein